MIKLSSKAHIKVGIDFCQAPGPVQCPGQGPVRGPGQGLNSELKIQCQILKRLDLESRVPTDLFTNTTTHDLSSNKFSLEVFAYSFCPSYPDMKSLIKVLYDGFSQTDVRQKLFLC